MIEEDLHMYIPRNCIYIHTKTTTKQNKMVKLDRGLEIRVLDGTFLNSIAVL